MATLKNFFKNEIKPWGRGIEKIQEIWYMKICKWGGGGGGE